MTCGNSKLSLTLPFPIQREMVIATLDTVEDLATGMAKEACNYCFAFFKFLDVFRGFLLISVPQTVQVVEL